MNDCFLPQGLQRKPPGECPWLAIGDLQPRRGIGQGVESKTVSWGELPRAPRNFFAAGGASHRMPKSEGDMERLEATISELENLLERRKWLVKRIREREKRYGLSTREFLEAWRSGRLPEPEDAEALEDFLGWEADAEELGSLDERLKSIAQRVEEGL
mgnify:CR=1 FL=1